MCALLLYLFNVRCVSRLHLFIYFKHINYDAVLTLTGSSHILQQLVRKVTYFKTYNFAIIPTAENAL